MNIKDLSIQELNCYFDLVSKMRERIFTMARTNDGYKMENVRHINEKYNIIQTEVMRRINEINNEETKENS